MILFVPAVISVADLELQKGGFSLVSRSQTLTGSLQESGYARLGSAISARSALMAEPRLPRPLPVTLTVRTEYLEATLGLVKCLEISKELIRECVTMPGCCCCMPLLHNHLMDSCSYNYVRQNTLLAAKRGVHLHPPYPP